MPTQLPTNMRPAATVNLVDVTALRDEILAAVQRDLIRAVGEALARATITSAAPIVTVSPTVEVAAPIVRVPTQPTPTIELELPGMSDLCSEMMGVSAKLDTLITLLSRPVVQDVERDLNGRIKRVTRKMT